MKIAITGAGGNLGRYTADELARAGHDVRLIDLRPLSTEFESVIADVRDREAIARAIDGCDAIVHAAALHGIHLAKWQATEFWEINATGTFNVYDAAQAAGIKKIVLCSTMGVYGSSIVPAPESWGYAHEELPLEPSDVYGLTKLVAEATAGAFARQGTIKTVALRLGMFVPESSLERYGFRLLFGGVDDRDVAHAVERAIVYDPEGGFEAFNVMAPTPFGPADLQDLRKDLTTVLERDYPGSRELLASRALDPSKLVWWPVLWSIERAKHRMGYRPRYGFGEFLAALREDRRDHSEVVGLPWWGT